MLAVRSLREAAEDAQPLPGMSRVREAISSNLWPVMKIRLGSFVLFCTCAYVL